MDRADALGVGAGRTGHPRPAVRTPLEVGAAAVDSDARPVVDGGGSAICVETGAGGSSGACTNEVPALAAGRLTVAVPCLYRTK